VTGQEATQYWSGRQLTQSATGIKCAVYVNLTKLDSWRFTAERRILGVSNWLHHLPNETRKKAELVDCRFQDVAYACG
jgi:hypothetical protein